MKYLLDTNICIYFLNRRSEQLIRRFHEIPRREISVCSIVKAELFFGALKSAKSSENIARQREFLENFHSFPFDDSAAEIYARIRSDLEKSGTPIGPNDLCIASIACANNLILVTHNIGEFSRISGLRWEDWMD